MQRFAWLVMMTVFLGCDTQSAKQRSKPIPPDDISNGPWKNQRQQRAVPEETNGQIRPPAEPD